jgi:UrcA family protein
MKSALCFLAACASAPALAQPPVIISGELLPFATVSYADLDLGQSTGVDRLRMRVRQSPEGGFP